MTTVAYPLVNGVYHAFASIELKLKDGTIYVGVKSINYKDSLTPVKVRGAHAEPIGRTRGDYDADGDLEMYTQQGHQFLQGLGQGYKETPWDGTVIYSENGFDTITDTVIGCRIQEVDKSNSQGTDATTTKFTLSIMKVLHDGLESLINPLSGQTAQQ